MIEERVFIGGFGGFLPVQGRRLCFLYRILQNRFNVGVHDPHRLHSLVAPKFEQRPQATSANAQRGYVLSLCKCMRKVVRDARVPDRVPDGSCVVGINKASGETVYTSSKEKLGCRIKREA